VTPPADTAIDWEGQTILDRAEAGHAPGEEPYLPQPSRP
jgi:hypothetical protein